ncbi:helix-turn-helix domain-containing protein [Maritimibacter sp. UBA3975]|uniref:winged helix-turn-helix transcriptional regulator n=1 Tax=Maritimibacter sp. UBA3975 TaxID=1946833 RepID=UPI000C099472|nr:helix-turn-helix domain-containing protein [Maritimibacter sp. UBA3975]MAM62628.1 transcriptional regulator [Maritimibacter sp.]|tara:strand:- start:10091 stop:10462 length:372 start_codon:yes stop_codon:yes gene_type:complete
MLKVTALTKADVDGCPVRQVLSKVTGKWQVLIVLSLEDGTLRFGELKRTIGDITQRVLTENLRSLERDGYVTRSVDPGPPIAVRYTLTDMGHELLPLLKALTGWAAERHADVKRARNEFDSRD